MKFILGILKELQDPTVGRWLLKFKASDSLADVKRSELPRT